MLDEIVLIMSVLNILFYIIGGYQEIALKNIYNTKMFNLYYECICILKNEYYSSYCKSLVKNCAKRTTNIVIYA